MRWPEHTRTRHDKIFVSRGDRHHPIQCRELDQRVDLLLELAELGDEENIRRELERIAPEYQTAAPISDEERTGKKRRKTRFFKRVFVC